MVANGLDFITILKLKIEHEVKEAIEEQILRPILEGLEKEVRGIIRDKLKQVSFDRIESMRDVSRMRDELYVNIRINGSEDGKE